MVHGHRERDAERSGHQVARLRRDLAVQGEREGRVSPDRRREVLVRHHEVRVTLATHQQLDALQGP